MGRNKVAYQFQLATFLISDSTSLWWVVVCKPISVLSFAQAEQFHVLKFGLSESKIMKNKFFWGGGRKKFFMGTLYILAFTRQDEYNLKEFIEENTT